METSPTIGALALALAKSGTQMGPLVAAKKADIKSSKGDYGYTYADLADALEACRAVLGANEVAIVQEAITPQDQGIEVRTMLIHSSGEWLRTEPLFMPVNGGAQAVGSAITYARRYQLLGLVGLAPEDDDGATAQANAPKAWDRKPQPKPPAKPAAREDAAAEVHEHGLDRVRVARLDADVKLYASANGLEIGKAWAEICGSLGLKVEGSRKNGPAGCTPDELAKIGAWLKVELAKAVQS